MNLLYREHPQCEYPFTVAEFALLVCVVEVRVIGAMCEDGQLKSQRLAKKA